MFFNTEALVLAAKRSEFFPVAQATFTDPDDLIAFANEEMMTKVVPTILSARQDYFLAQKVIAMRSNLNHYALPERAIGNDLKDLFYLPNSGNLDYRYPIARRQVHDVASYTPSGNSPSGFYLRSDEVVITPTPGTVTGTDALLALYFMRPNRLVPTSSCAKVTAVSSNAITGVTTLTVDTDLTATTTPIAVGSLLDVLSGVSPFRLSSIDVSVSSITSTQIQVSTPAVSDESLTVTVNVGDYLCPAQTSCIPMIPQEFHPILAEFICFRALKALGAGQKLSIVASNIKDMMAGAMKVISTRVESEPDVVYDRDGLAGLTSSFSQFVLR